MVATVAAANVMKGSVLLLSCCNRGGRPSTCSFPYYYSQVKGKGNGVGVLLGSLSLSLGCKTAAAVAARGVFCAAGDAVTSYSTTPPPPPSPEEADDSSSSAAAAVDSSSVPTTLSSNDPIKDAANTLDIRVGRILRVWRHAEADSLYVEEVDVGEPEPRIICSGLVNYIPLDHLQDKRVVVLANMKSRNMRGIKSCGMLMAASDALHANIELLVPPEDSFPGERIWFGLENEKENLPVSATPNQIQKKKIWELVQPHLKTDASCVAALGVHFMRTSTGVVVCKSLKNASIS